MLLEQIMAQQQAIVALQRQVSDLTMQSADAKGLSA